MREKASWRTYQKVQRTGNVCFLLLMLVWQFSPALALANPTGGEVVGGSANISASGNTTTITQNSARAIINWQSFSIGSGELTKFLQPDSSSIALNRVLGGNVSAIYGSLQANGQVYLINPNGVLVGPGGTVNTAGFLASTLDVANAEFMAGGTLRFVGDSNAKVINKGTITAIGGDVYLIAAKVINKGTITADNGVVGLAGGHDVLLQQSGDEHLFVVAGSNGSVKNAGTIQAAQAELKAAGGNAYALAINNTGVIRATGTAVLNGKVRLVSSSGTTQNIGTIVAKNANGSGGFIETSGRKVVLNGDITTGTGGFWLIDPDNLTIDSAAATTIVGALNAGTDVLEQTTASGTSGYGTVTSGNGDIIVAAAIRWTGTGTLTLDAYHDIVINAAIRGNSGGLALNAGNAISAPAAISVATFSLLGGAWSQIGTSLPSFFAKDFRISGGTFLRVLGGDGSSGNAYQIADVYGLQGAGTYLSSHFILANDVNASGTTKWNSGAGFKPIGDVYNPLTGSFDGAGHTIDGLFINRPLETYVGLFGLIDYGASVSNVNLTNVLVQASGMVGGLAGGNFYGVVSGSTVTGTVTGSSLIGGLIGINYGSISSSSVTITAKGEYYIGGLVGLNYGTISDSVVNGTVKGDQYVGGLVGYNYRGDISGSSVSATITSGTYAGGLVGYNDAGTIRSSWTSVTVKSTGDYAGGLVGINNSGNITDSYATGTVSAVNYVGGLVGYSAGSISNSSVSAMFVRGTGDNVGGLTGYASGSIGNSSVTATVTGSNYVGGLVGYNTASLSGNSTSIVLKATGDNAGGLAGYNEGVVSNNSATGTITGSGFVGGLIGWNNSAAITNSSASVTIKGTSDNVGGLVGKNQWGSISGSYATGTVTGRNYTGGLVGMNVGDTSGTGAIQTSSTSAITVNGGSYSGGLVGYNDGGVITGSSVAGAVNGSAYVGGLVGYNTGSLSGTTASVTVIATGANVGGLVGYNTGDVTNSSVTGSVTGKNYTGGLIGYNSGTVSQSYALSTVSGSTAVGGLAGFNDGTLAQSYATGSVVGGGRTGGLVGSNSGTITNAYATGSVTGTANVGGLVGYNTGTISYTYATGAVSGTSNKGGLVGYNVGSGVTKSYFATDGTGQSSWRGAGSGAASSATASTLVAMKNSATYAGWNFILPTGNNATLTTNGIWGTDDSGVVNSGLPFFQWQYPILVLAAKDQAVSYGSTINTTPIRGTTYRVAGLSGSDTVGSVLTGIGLSVSGTNVNVGTTNSIVISGTQVGTKYVLKKVSGTESFTAVNITVTALSGAGISTYGDTPSNPGLSATGLVNGETASVLTGLYNSFGITATSSATTYTLTVAGALTNPNYVVTASTSGSWLVNPAAVNVTVGNASSTYGTTPDLSGVTYTVGALKNGETQSVLGLSAITMQTGATPVGVYTSAISAISTNSNYFINYTLGTLTINPAALTITATNAKKNYGETQVLNAFNTTGLVNSDAVTGATLFSLGADATAKSGTYSITISNAVGTGLSNYTITYVGGIDTVVSPEQQSIDGFGTSYDNFQRSNAIYQQARNGHYSRQPDGPPFVFAHRGGNPFGPMGPIAYGSSWDLN